MTRVPISSFFVGHVCVLRRESEDFCPDCPVFAVRENRHLQTPMSTRNGDIASFLNIVNLVSPTTLEPGDQGATVEILILLHTCEVLVSFC